MGRHFRVSFMKPDSASAPDPLPEGSELPSPFGIIEVLTPEDLRQAAYEVFLTACRSSPGFSGRVNSYSVSDADGDPGSPGRPQGVGMAVTSRLKAALGLKTMFRRTTSRVSSLRRASSGGMNPASPTGSPRGAPGRLKRAMTSSEIMRQQMRVTEQSDNRLRKTLTRILVGQMGARRPETIIVPLELLRHLKPSEFNDASEYHSWQLRQLKLLEASLILYPSTPLPKSNPNVTKLREIIHSSKSKPLDTTRNSRATRTLSDCIVALASRSSDSESDAFHWADGYPLNLHIYTSLLRSIFDLRDETMVLDEVDELLELMTKTWPILGLNRSIHNLCFAWVLFEQFVVTGQVEPDLVGASFTMLKEVEADAKKANQDPVYTKMLPTVLAVMTKWSERRLLDYHANFNCNTVGLMETMAPLLFSSSKILQETSPYPGKGMVDELSGSYVDNCIRISLRNAFARMVDQKNTTDAQATSEALIKLATKTEELARKEMDVFSPVLQKWIPGAAGIATVTLHACYGTVLRQYVASKCWQLSDILPVLQRAGQLEKDLAEMVSEESSIKCEDEVKVAMKQMSSYDVEAVVMRLLKQWIQERTQKGKELLLKAKQSETWNPKSKNELYAHSATELIVFANEAIQSFFQLPISMPEILFQDFVSCLENAFSEYIAFVASCGSKQNFLPTVPPPTRCSSGSKLFKLWRKTACGVEEQKWDLSFDGVNHQFRTPTSRGTHRLYIRLNTLHYIASQLSSLEKSLSQTPNVPPSKSLLGSRSQRRPISSHFENCFTAVQSASQHVAEVAAHRLIFLDSNSVFYGGLYARTVGCSRIGPVVQSLQHNLALLCTVVVERAQPLILKEVIRASFEAFLRVLLTGGSTRMFTQADHPMIEEDLDSLKRVFCTCGEGLIVEDIVEREAEAAQGVVALMGQATEQLIEDFISIVTTSCGNGSNLNQKIAIPVSTGNWNRSDANTVVRVLCSRKDRTANDFLKRTLRLARRR